MTGYLLDTNVTLLALADPFRLPGSTRSALLEGANVISVISYWEVMLKSMKGKLDVGDPDLWWTLTQEQLQAATLGLRAEHVAAVRSLPPIHGDPFDRMLLAQAKVAGLTFLTADSVLGGYAAERLQIVY